MLLSTTKNRRGLKQVHGTTHKPVYTVLQREPYTSPLIHVQRELSWETSDVQSFLKKRTAKKPAKERKSDRRREKVRKEKKKRAAEKTSKEKK